MADRYCNPERIVAWLRGEVDYLLIEDEQDMDLLIAMDYDASELISFFSTNNAVPERRDEIAAAICHRLECLLAKHGCLRRVSQNEVAALTEVIRDNLDEFCEGDKRLGFGIKFEEIILPHVLSSSQERTDR